MDTDPYKCLLASASREHLKRQAELNDRFVGNVFLPAIHKTSRAHGAASPLKHLKVIEQCIMAENKREEQLAKCQNDREKRFWSRKFNAQRTHERDLIQALMLGTTTDAALEIADIDTEDSAVTLSRSPLHVDVQHRTTGITAKIPSEDRVFHKAKVAGGVPNTKPHIRKKFNLPECQGSQTHKVKPYQPRPANVLASASPDRKSLSLNCQAQPTAVSKTGGGSASPPPHRGSRSATPLRISPSKPKAVEPPPPVGKFSPHSKSSLKQNRTGVISGTGGGGGGEHSPKKKHVKGAAARGPRVPLPPKESFNTEELLLEIETFLSFEGPTSFHEVKQIAMAAFSESSDDATDVKPVDFLETRNGGEQHFSQAEAESVSDTSEAHSEDRPAAAAEPGGADEQAAARDEEEEQWEIYDDPAEDAISTPLGGAITGANDDEAPTAPNQQHFEEVDAPLGMSDGAGTTMEHDLLLEELGSEVVELSAQQQETSDLFTEPAAALLSDCLGIISPANGEDDLDEQAEMEVAEVLFDLVDQIAADGLSGGLDAADSPRSAAFAGRPRSASVHIQSAFRGHQARRAFRMALYQEALSCGMLGAMPGTLQGQSGWYQDPKSLMAYYFTVVADTGEWKQKLVVRCSRLVLTSYEMREEILSKVFISPSS